MLADGITISKMVDDPRYDRDGNREARIRVEFFVDKHGPFTEWFPKTDLWAQVRDEKLNAFALQVRSS